MRRIAQTLSGRLRVHAGTAVAMATLAALLAGIHVWVRDVHDRSIAAELRANAAIAATPYASSLGGALNERLALVRGLAAYVTVKAATGDLPQEFPSYAEALRGSAAGIRNISVAPDFVVRHVHPVAGNASVLGNDLMKDTRPGFADTVRRAVATRDVTTHGPLTLIQGGRGLIARAAVFRDGTPWGAVGVALDVQPILDEANLTALAGRYAYGVRTVTGMPVAGDPAVFGREPILERIRLPDAEWELALVPRLGWDETVEASTDHRLMTAAFLIVALLSEMVVFLVAGRRAALESVVERRTRELRLAHGDADRRARDLEQFAYAAAHDLQEPVRAIGSYAQLLKRTMPEATDSEEHLHLGYVLDGAKRLKTLLHDIELFVAEERAPLPESPSPAEDGLKEALRALRPRITATGATVTHDPLPAVLADTRRLREVFKTLIGNAIEYRHPERPPAIHVGARREDDMVVLSVTDNGIGIEGQYHEQIFQVFRRLHTRDEHPGTGMGLAIARKMAERLGGGIEVRSEPGQGSTFSVRIPANHQGSAV